MVSTLIGWACLGMNLQADVSPIDEVLDKLVAEDKIPGAVIQIKMGGKMVYERAVGKSNLETGTTMQMESVHELASVSKQFTATATLLMVEDKKLTLDDTIDKFLTGEPEAWKKVTIRQLLHHTSGLPDYINEEFDASSNLPLESHLQRIYSRPIVFEPGAKWEYSNTGYMLLGLIVDKVSPNGFYDVLRKRIFEPAGMKSAVITNPRDIVKNRAFGYSKLENKWVNEEYCAPNVAAPGDGMVSASAADLMAWHEVIKGRKILQPSSWEFLFTPSKQSEGEDARPYSAGFVLERSGAQPRVSHGGGWIGTLTYFMSDSEKDNAMVILVNCDDADVRLIMEAVRKQFPDLE